MILNTGSRTDIPAFFSDWFYNRIQEGYVLVRNPYYPQQVTRYRLAPELVDALIFCTKNPEPMLARLNLLKAYAMFWSVTITPYGEDIEPYVPAKAQVAASFRRLAELLGPEKLSWRYDPVLITETYTIERHIKEFRGLAEALSGSTDKCVVSFIDLYAKTVRNFPEARAVSALEQRILIDAFSNCAAQNGMRIYLCCEDAGLAGKNVDAGGCLSQQVLESALGLKLRVPRKKPARRECACLLGADIGAYNTCAHGCKYCYANYDRVQVLRNLRKHDKTSPFLIGGLKSTDIIKDAVQSLWQEREIDLFGPGA